MRLVDANVVLRHLLDDHPDMSARAQELLAADEVHLRLEVLCEVVYVLQKLYGVPRDRIQADLTAFLGADTVSTEDFAVACRALEFYRDENIDIVDAILCAFADLREADVLTFDRKMMKLITRLRDGRQVLYNSSAADEG